MEELSNEMEGKYMTTVRIGPKGQIVIPKEVRRLFTLRPGDSVLLLADETRGIALQPMERSCELFDRLFPPKAPS